MLPKFLHSTALLCALAGAPALAQQAPASITDGKARGLYEKAQSLFYRDRQPQQALLVWQQLTDKFPDYGEPFLRKASLLTHPRRPSRRAQSLSAGPGQAARGARPCQ